VKTREEEVAHALVHRHRIRLLLSPSLLNPSTRQTAVERLVKADCGNEVEDETKAVICSMVVANLGEVQSTKVKAAKRGRTGYERGSSLLSMACTSNSSDGLGRKDVVSEGVFLSRVCTLLWCDLPLSSSDQVEVSTS